MRATDDKWDCLGRCDKNDLLNKTDSYFGKLSIDSEIRPYNHNRIILQVHYVGDKRMLTKTTAKFPNMESSTVTQNSMRYGALKCY